MRLIKTFINVVIPNFIFQIIEAQPSSGGENSCAPYPQNPITGFHEVGTNARHHTRIIGGYPVPYGDAPWQAVLYNMNQLWGGGTLISEMYVITAAHCMTYEKESYKIILGNHFLSKNDSGEVERKIALYKRHSKYDLNAEHTNNFEYDIALIKLDKPVTFSKYVQPACLGINEPKEGAKVFVSGWGITEDKEKSDILKGVQVTVYPWEKCTAMYRKPDPVEGATSNITTRMICTLDTSKDACQGDSGGGMIMNENEIATLVGIVSFGFDCADPNYPGIYTKIASYYDWIISNMKHESNSTDGTNLKFYSSSMAKTRNVPNSSSSKELDSLLVNANYLFKKTKFDKKQKDFMNAVLFLIKTLTAKVIEIIDQKEVD